MALESQHWRFSSKGDTFLQDFANQTIAGKRCAIPFSFPLIKAKMQVRWLSGVYGADTVTANYVQFWFRRFRSGIFVVKDAPLTGRSVAEIVDKITETIGINHYVRSMSPRS
ncbi:hypothetical protein TNCV_527321 [Trichonephila clavipes]|nr:hypothetical protein TNCV_527321 [Trichonephila clavipes]